MTTDNRDGKLSSKCAHMLPNGTALTTGGYTEHPAGKKYDSGKLRYSLLPKGALEAIVQVLEHGATKYAPNNWQLVDNAEDRYYDALMRHLAWYRSGESFDRDSGLPHLAHVMCNAAFLLWFEQQRCKGTE
jgi:hypothetical protein